MEYEQWLEILSAINADDNLNKDNVIEKIKEKLEKENLDTYQEWQDNLFGINYIFNSQFTLLHIAASGFVKVGELLIKKGADPLLENKSYRSLKRLTELIKSLEHSPGKKEETQQREADGEYELLKYSLLSRNGCSLIDTVRRDTFDNLICTWFADVSGLTPKQNEFNKKLLSIIKDLPYFSSEDSLRGFLLCSVDKI